MTYHMENYMNGEQSKVLKLTDDSVILFPAKLFRAANAGYGLIEWSEEGTALHVNSLTFEHLIMTLHPSLVEIPNFANFRRQMRAYGFSWSLLFGDIFEFRHNFFKRDRQDLLKCVLTRRKQIKFDAAKMPGYKQRGSRYNRDCSKTSHGIMKRQHYRRNRTDVYSGECTQTSEDIDERQESPRNNEGSINNFPMNSKDHTHENQNKFNDNIDFELYYSCLGWFLQQDPMLARYYEQDMLMDCLKNVEDLVKISVHFY